MTTLFSNLLYKETQTCHSKINNHPFSKLIKTDKNIGKIYINFNKICIDILQNALNKKIKDGVFLNFTECYNKLYRKILYNDLYISTNLSYLLTRCKDYPLEHAYMFYLGLLMGGNILAKYLPEHTSFLQFNESSKLIKEFKNYLDNTIITKQQQTNFINIINQSYSLINIIFTDFSTRHNLIHSSS